MAASEEHDLAAAEFAAAAQGTNDTEAQRILNLLEQHHKRLGQLLKSTREKSVSEAIDTAEKNEPVKITVTPGDRASESPKALGVVERAIATNSPVPPRLTRTSTPSGRELSSSIASNLASARGIPPNRQRRPEPVSPTISTQHAGGRFATDHTHREALSRQRSDKQAKDHTANRVQPNKPSWAPPLSATPLEPPVEEEDQGETARSDAPFQQFYNTFENLITKISAPLAFTGLPLTSPSTQRASASAPPAPKSRLQKPIHQPAAQPEPSLEYSHLISPAALRAVRDEGPSNPAESFYVVTPTGGTVSYAEIMSRAERENKRASWGHTREPSGLNEDDFFDARTTVPSIESLDQKTPTGKKKRAVLSQDSKTVAGKTMEELALENQALKHLADTLSKRLHVFELSAQSSSAALAQSIRSLQRSPLTTPENSGRGPSGRGVVDEKLKTRIAELEEILKNSDRENQKRKEENAKLKDTVLRYREKWEKLKEGARARREGLAGGEKEAVTGSGSSRGVDNPMVLLGAPVEPEQEVDAT